jgi:hypothetical protein
MNGIVVDTRTGEFVAAGDLGNLAEAIQALYECDQDVSHYQILPEDEAYAEYA